MLSTKTGIVKLTDFAVATKLSEVDSSKRRVVGTPYWMAPEVVETLGEHCWFRWVKEIGVVKQGLDWLNSIFFSEI